jgi:hypothetical protein
MPFILVSDLVARARDEDGMPLPPVFVYGWIEASGKSGQVMRGRPVDGAGEPGAEVDIPAGDWRRMRFPIASPSHPHDTFWNYSGQLAYIEIKAITGAAQAEQRNTRRPNRGRPAGPVWDLIKPDALKWLAKYGVPVPGDGALAGFERHLDGLLKRRKERSSPSNITRHAKRFIVAFEQQQRRGP